MIVVEMKMAFAFLTYVDRHGLLCYLPIFTLVPVRRLPDRRPINFIIISLNLGWDDTVFALLLYPREIRITQRVFLRIVVSIRCRLDDLLVSRFGSNKLPLRRTTEAEIDTGDGFVFYLRWKARKFFC